MRTTIVALGAWLVFGVASDSIAGHTCLEKVYQEKWCAVNNGVTEVVLPDKARVDCVTKDHAIEFDFAPKWAESIGQALYYAKVLDKKPGVVLILEKGNDGRYLRRLKTVADEYGITVWTMDLSDCIK